jgi:hypothetical protein
VKFCGGCNPEYDRVGLLEELADNLKELFDFIPASAKEAHIILAIEGCRTACADLSPFADKPLVLNTGVSDMERLVHEIKECARHIKGDV